MMLASGFIVLKVVNMMGEHLICEVCAPGAPVRTIHGWLVREYVSYMDIWKGAFENESEDADGTKEEKGFVSMRVEGSPKVVLRLIRTEVSWNQVAGLYIRDAKSG